ncbi:unnamed protein product [Brassica oleracea var. botrytis]
MRRLKRSAERAAWSHHGLASTTRFNASRRTPSWNVISRENSTGSLDDLVAESNLHASSGRKLSDSETESVELSSWTRTGGPLMRTASANKFIDFVQSLDVDIALTRGFSSSPSSPAANTSSITVTEGDFLQPERTSNGNHNTKLPESVQLDIPEKEMYNCSKSEHEVDQEDDDEEYQHNRSVPVTVTSDDFGLQEPMSGSMIMKSEGRYQCNKPEDCDPRGCRGYTHPVCKNRRCTCDLLIGNISTGVRDCVRNGCPPNNHVICNRYAGVYEGACLCIPN